MSKSAKPRVQSARPTTTIPSTSSRSTPPDRRRNRDRGRAATPAPGGMKRLRSRHPVLSALVPVALVLAVIATMVIVKATSSSSAPPPAASRLAAGETGGTWSDPGTSALAPGVVASLSVPAATLDSVGKPASVVVPSPTSDGGSNPPRRRRQAGRHLRRGRVLPLLRGAALGHRRGPRDSGPFRTCRPRTRRPTTSTPTPRRCPFTGRTIRARISTSTLSRKRRTKR